MSNKHTPGPWIVDGKTNLPYWRWRDNDYQLRAIHSTKALPIEVALVWVDNDVGESNAILVAAVTDLLDAAILANRAIHDHQIALGARLRYDLLQSHKVLTEAQASLEAAIAKATREEPPDQSLISNL